MTEEEHVREFLRHNVEVAPELVGYEEVPRLWFDENGEPKPGFETVALMSNGHRYVVKSVQPRLTPR